MKDFFEDLGKRLSETAEAVTAKAGDAIEIQKLKAQIRELARGNAEDLMELGQSIYDRFENGEELDEASKGLCEAIASRKESMEEYEKKAATVKNETEYSHIPEGMKMKELSDKKKNIKAWFGWAMNGLRFLF